MVMDYDDFAVINNAKEYESFCHYRKKDPPSEYPFIVLRACCYGGLCGDYKIYKIHPFSKEAVDAFSLIVIQRTP